MAKARFAIGTLVTLGDATIEVQGVNITRNGDIYDVKTPDGEIEQVPAKDLKKIKETGKLPPVDEPDSDPSGDE